MINRRNSLFAIVLSMILMSSLVFASCASKPDNLESFLKSNEDVKADIDAAAESAGMTVEVKGNDVIYTYDLSTIDGVTEDMLKDEAMINTLQSSLDSMESTFVDTCKKLEEETGFTGIQMIVNFTYGDEVLVTQTFTSGGKA